MLVVEDVVVEYGVWISSACFRVVLLGVREGISVHIRKRAGLVVAVVVVEVDLYLSGLIMDNYYSSLAVVLLFYLCFSAFY